MENTHSEKQSVETIKKELFYNSTETAYDDSIKNALECISKLLDDIVDNHIDIKLPESEINGYIISEVQRKDLITYLRDIKRRFKDV